MAFFTKNTINCLIFRIILPAIFILTLQANSQDQDSLIEKIKLIDVSLDQPVDEEEDLYLNTVSFQSFYDVLSPMGEWIQITKEDIDEDLNDGEGESFVMNRNTGDELFFIWKPNTDNNWKPYANGKWEYTDHGWLWVSADTWGNATYNYGRWWNSPKYGWVWLPGYTWAPAWVRWKVTNDDKYIGWVPLSPKAKWKSETGITEKNYNYKNKDADWVFVENSTFAEEISLNRTINQSENYKLVNSSTDITDLKVDNDRIFNKGPDVIKMEEKTGKKFRSKKMKFKEGNGTAVIGDDEVIIGRERFRHGESKNKESVGKPKSFKKSDRVKKVGKKKKNNRRPPPGRHR
jgi:hypothetical protein